eukprot:Phypoly_transcript_13486.p1 GENE.Phypoly_transcript_13486~~Phypoly_transcript_13486.p1  ORF type:complete len:326 (+),score=55.67 Phypoly_transcript_13486:52-1029(+)
MSVPVTRWAIFSTGNIAHAFAEVLVRRNDCQIVAIASRTAKSAADFGKKFGVEELHCYGSCEEALQKEAVDIVYIASVPSVHAEHMKICIRHKVATLCEKPFTLNKAEAEEVVRLAKENNVLLMEAMKMRYSPAYKMIKSEKLVEKIGGHTLWADIGIKTTPETAINLFKKDLAGGSIGAVGVYPFNLAFALFGKPVDYDAKTDIDPKNGIDTSCFVNIKHENGERSSVGGSVLNTTPSEAIIFGKTGTIKISAKWWNASELIISDASGTKKIALPTQPSSFDGEIDEIIQLRQEKKIESEIFPLSEVIEIVGFMENLICNGNSQ